MQVKTLGDTLWVYLALSGVSDNQTTGTELWRARLQNKALTDITQLYAMPLTTASGRHFGGRIALTDQHVFLTIGDRGERERAQDISEAGSIIRLNLDGSIPSDNPIFASPNGQNCIPWGTEILKALLSILRAIYMLTNMVRKVVMKLTVSKLASIMVGQLLPMDATTGLALPSERVPKKRGSNNHSSTGIHPLPLGHDILFRKTISRMEKQIRALKAQMLVRLAFENGRLKQKERLYRGEYGRIRDVREGPDGALYLLTDSTRGQLLRITP